MIKVNEDDKYKWNDSMLMRGPSKSLIHIRLVNMRFPKAEYKAGIK